MSLTLIYFTVSLCFILDAKNCIFIYDCQTGIANKNDRILAANVKTSLKMADCVIWQLL